MYMYNHALYMAPFLYYDTSVGQPFSKQFCTNLFQWLKWHFERNVFKLCKDHLMLTHLCPVGAIKYKQQWTLLSGTRGFLLMLVSSFKYLLYCSFIYWRIGSQLQRYNSKHTNLLVLRCLTQSFKFLTYM